MLNDTVSSSDLIPLIIRVFQFLLNLGKWIIYIHSVEQNQAIDIVLNSCNIVTTL